MDDRSAIQEVSQQSDTESLSSNSKDSVMHERLKIMTTIAVQKKDIGQRHFYGFKKATEPVESSKQMKSLRKLGARSHNTRVTHSFR